jgi:hypothetical protein
MKVWLPKWHTSCGQPLAHMMNSFAQTIESIDEFSVDLIEFFFGTIGQIFR